MLAPLTFGTIAIPENSSVLTYDVRPSGNMRVDAGIIVAAPGAPATFRLTGFPPNESISVSVPDVVLVRTTGGFTPTFEVIQFSASPLITDSLGQGLLHLGATLSTSGTGQNYLDGDYRPSVAVSATFLFWSPEEGAFVTRNQTFDIGVDLRTSLTLEEQQPFSFGTLFARSEPGHTASLQIAPNGAYSVSESGSARMVSIVAPRPGVIRVSGAAPNYDVAITLQSDPVTLRRSGAPVSAPGLVVSDFVSSPAGVGRTNDQGQLDIRVGGRLSTELTPAPYVYPQGVYTGTYTLTVTY